MIVQPARRLDSVEEYYFAHKLREVRGLISEGKDVINLGIGNPDLPPSAQVIDRLRDAAADGTVHGYQPYKGIAELRQAMANYYLNTYNVSVDPEREILPLMGSKEGIFHLSMAFLDPGDEVLVPNPGYLGYASAARLAGASVRLYDLNEENNWLPDLDALEKTDLRRLKLMWLNYPHMPTGAVANSRFFARVSDFGARNGILICHDNPYSQIDNNEPLSIFNGGSMNNCVELNSLSKSHNMAGWRIGMYVGAEKYLKHVIAVKSNLDSGMFKATQLAAVEALTLPTDWHRSQSEVYRRRKDLVYRMLDSLGCRYSREGAGMFVWSQVPDEIDNVEHFADSLLHEKHVFFAPGFIFGSNGKRYLRVSVCAADERIEEAINRII